MRIALIGAVESTLVAVSALYKANNPPVVLGTLPLRLQHRHADFVNLRPAALDLSIPILDVPRTNNPQFIEQLERFSPDVVLIIGWSQLVGRSFLNRFPVVVGYHPSLLPKNRGRGVLGWTILQRAKKTGGTLFLIDEGMDTGDIVFQESFSLNPHATIRSLYDQHMTALSRMISTFAADPERLIRNAKQQDHGAASFCARRVAEDSQIDWRQSADDIWTLIRASGEPYHGAFSYYGGKKIIIWEANLVMNNQRHWASPGQVVEADGSGFSVFCGDSNLIEVKKWEIAGEKTSLLKLHARLGGKHENT